MALNNLKWLISHKTKPIKTVFTLWFSYTTSNKMSKLCTQKTETDPLISRVYSRIDESSFFLLDRNLKFFFFIFKKCYSGHGKKKLIVITKLMYSSLIKWQCMGESKWISSWSDY